MSNESKPESEESGPSFTEEQKADNRSVYKIKGALVRTKEGTLLPTKAFAFMDIPLDDYSDLEFSYDQVKRVQMHTMKMRTGFQAMAPCLCSGPAKCLFRFRCPLVDRTKLTISGEIDFQNQNLKAWPLLRQCIFERDFMEFQRTRYMEEYGVDLSSPTEMAMVSRLAELDLYEYRLTQVLASGDNKGEGIDLLKEQVTGQSLSGQWIKKLEVHPAFDLKERLHRMREDILKSMVGTRRERYKQAQALKEKTTGDPSTVISSLRDRLEKMESDTIVEAEFKESK